MKRSDINHLVKRATACWAEHGWTLPPNPRWDVTDFGLGDWSLFGLVVVNLANEPEYCEKLMYIQCGMVTPAHTHAKKKEDIICRWGELEILVWKGKPSTVRNEGFSVNVNGEPRHVRHGEALLLRAGERVTLEPGVYHEFVAVSDECIIGEVSTANDDLHDNFFMNPAVGRFTDIEDDVPATVKLVNE